LFILFITKIAHEVQKYREEKLENREMWKSGKSQFCRTLPLGKTNEYYRIVFSHSSQIGGLSSGV